MTGTKNFFASKGVWGGFLALAPQIAAMIDPELAGLVTQGISVFGGLLAVYGRVSAKTSLTM